MRRPASANLVSPPARWLASALSPPFPSDGAGELVDEGIAADETRLSGAVGQTAGADGATSAAEDVVAGGNAIANPLRGTMNCVACAIAGDLRLAGSAASALKVGAQPISVLEKMFGGSFGQVSGPMQIGSILSKAGRGPVVSYSVREELAR